MVEEIYRLEAVGYEYAGIAALKDINLSVKRGEALSILGSNGSGKTTLLKVLDGLIFPAEGRVFFMGSPLTEDGLNTDFLRCFRQRVGFVFPEPDVQLFSPTVFDEVAFGPLQLDIPEDEARGRVSDTIEMLGITRLKDRPPYTLSSGEKKKVAIASVLSMNPDVLLMDEPTNGLDPRTQVWLFELMESLKALKAITGRWPVIDKSRLKRC